MRTSVYTFLFITCLLLTPCAFSYAGTDDSGLQVFTIDFSKQLGESADVAQEDTLFSPYCYNMFSSGNGICSFPKPKGTGQLFYSASAVDGAEFLTFGGAAVRIDSDTTGTGSVWLHYSAGLTPSPLGSRVELDNNCSTSSNSDIFAFNYGGTQAVFLGNKIINVSGTVPSVTTAEITLTGLAFPLATYPHRSAAIWQNRLFLTCQNYLSYSAAQDFTVFTASAAAGGITRLYDATYISKIIATRYGLYIFTNEGIYIQTGSGAKNSWQIEKISNQRLPDFDSAVVYNDIIYFKAFQEQGKKIWTINGVNVSPLVDIPPEVSTNLLYHQIAVINSGRLIVLANSTVGGTSYVYDIQNKYWIRTSEFSGFISGGNYYIKKATGSYRIYYLPVAERFNGAYDSDLSTLLTPLYPWQYNTSWLTLDGNSGNRKEIDRVEFDYQGGTVAVGLYYAYGNGSSSGGITTLVAPINTRLSTYVWNAPIGRTQSNRFYLCFLSSGTQTMTTNYILKQARIYYRNIGNYKTNSLR